MISDSLWWQHGVIYQIYPRSFQDSNHDGTGDLPGISSRLAYLRWLGVDAIWISPFYPSPLVDSGYDVSDYTNVDSIFGDLTAFDELVQQAHQQNIKVIIDFVINHTSDQHPWFLDARSAKAAPHRDWYVWADARADGSPPNNWVSYFGGSAWQWDAATSQYYLHSFDSTQPDLNWRNPAVQTAMLDVLRFWLDHAVDGFRVDAAHMIMKDPAMRDNPLNLNDTRVMFKPMGDYDYQLHIYDKGHPDVHTVYGQIRRLLDTYSQEHDRIVIGELHILDWQEWVRYYGTNLDEMHMPFNFSMLGAPWQAQAIRRSVDELEAHLPVGAWPNHVLGNHDEPRIASRIGDPQARLAMLMLLTLRGTPTLYYGDELGMHNGIIPPALVSDPIAKNNPGTAMGRDPERTPMQWDTTPHAGFCPPTATPWLPISDASGQLNVAVERDDPTSFLTLTRRLLQLRHSTPALTRGSYQPIDDGPDDCFLYLRTTADQRYLIVLNFTAQTRLLHLPTSGTGQVVLSTSLEREEPVDLANLHLSGNEGIIIEVVP